MRTALESGAAHVTVVARRLGTICPKMIDYLNFVKPWDEQYRHDPLTNIKQMKCWRDCYIKSGAVAPEVWPGKVKHDGHTISVSDIWFVAHHLGKMCTKVGTLESMVEGGCVLSDGSFLPADIVRPPLAPPARRRRRGLRPILAPSPPPPPPTPCRWLAASASRATRPSASSSPAGPM